MKFYWIPSLIVLLAACTGSEDIVGPPRDAGVVDAGRDGGPALVGPATCADVDSPEPNLFGTEALDGWLAVFPSPEAEDDELVGTVMVTLGQAESITAPIEGRCAILRDPRLVGTVDVHVFAENQVYFSLLGVERSVLAPPINRKVPQVATISGEVTGWDVLTATAADVARITYAYPIQRTAFDDFPDPTDRPASPFYPTNISVVGAGLEAIDYEVPVYPWQSAGVYLIAGTWMRAPNTVSVTHFGLARDIFVMGSEARTDVQLDIAHPLVDRYTLDHDASVVTAVMALRFPDATLIPFAPVSDANGQAVFMLPQLVGELADATWEVFAAGDAWATAAPSSGFSNTVGRPPAALTNFARADRAAAVTVNQANAQYISFSISNPGTGRTEWQMLRLGAVEVGQNIGFRIPKPPVGIEDPLVRERRFTVYVASLEGAIATEDVPQRSILRRFRELTYATMLIQF